MYQIRSKEEIEIPNIGTAWLLLSHGAWLGAALGACSIGASLYTIVKVNKIYSNVQALAIGWFSISIMIIFWTLYAINKTWEISKKLKNPLFSDFGFQSLILVALLILGGTIWSLVDVCI